MQLIFRSAQTDLPLDRALADLLSSALGRKVGRSWARSLLLERRIVGPRGPMGLGDRASDGLKVSVELTNEEWRGPSAGSLFQPENCVVYRDAHWLAIAKPAGLLVHPGADKTQSDLVTAVAAWLGPATWTLHHRLDRETSGLVLFSLSAEGRVSVAAQFEQRQVEKGYLGRVASPGRAGEKWTCNAPLGERRGRVEVEGPGAKPAQTDFRRLDSTGLVEALPRTGRKHQIRVHLASQGRPLVGDTLYGGAAAPRLMLHAHWLRLRHPEGEWMTLKAEPPADFTAF
jgi:RluA family pseudouridine synthase